MAEYLSGELWFYIAKNNFDVWRALTRTVKAFWLYVQQNGGEKLVEKLFGRIYSDVNQITWKIATFSYRYGNLPRSIMKEGCIWKGPRGNEKPFSILVGNYCSYIMQNYFNTGRNALGKINFSSSGSYSYNFGGCYEDGNLECDDYFCYRINLGTIIGYSSHCIYKHRLKSKLSIGNNGSMINSVAVPHVTLKILYSNGCFSM